jgi:hypothetical protein
MTVSPAACTPAPHAAAQPRLTAPKLITKIRETFAALHEIQYRAPWDEPNKRWINLR